MHSTKRAALAGLAAVLIATAASAGEVKITIRDGRVTLMATDATIREILTEWSRVGGTAIVNADRLPGAPITIQFQDVPETQALESLLRSSNGYILASREVPAAGVSSVERIFVYPIPPVATPSASSTVPVPRPAGAMGQGPPFGRGRNQPGVNQPGGDDPDDESLVGAPRMMGRGGAGGSAVGRPAETTFDYANPMQIRQAMEQAGSESGNVVSGSTAGGATVVSPSISVNPYGTTLVNPYTGQPVVTPTPTSTSSSTSGAAAVGSATRPGMVVAPANQQQQTNPQNPYGLPTGVRPGSVVGQPVEPDRSKYTNPPRPPDTTTTTGGGRGGR